MSIQFYYKGIFLVKESMGRKPLRPSLCTLCTHCSPTLKRVTPSSFSSSSVGVQRLWHCFVPVLCLLCAQVGLSHWDRKGDQYVCGVGGIVLQREVWEGCKWKQWGGKMKLKCYSSVVLKGPIFFQGDCKREMKGESPKSVYALPSPGGQRAPLCPAPLAALVLQRFQPL